VLAVGDAEFQKKCLGKMRDVAGLGRTVLFVSHNMAAVRTLCKSCIMLRSGQLIAIGDPGAVISQYMSQQSEALEFSREPLAIDRPHITAAAIEDITQGPTRGETCLKVRVVAHSARETNVEISALLQDNIGAPIGFAPVGTLMSQAPARLYAGGNTFLLAIDVSRLALGQYSLTLQISRPLGELLDTCQDCLTFDLGSEHFSDVINPFRQDWQVGSVMFPSEIRRITESAGVENACNP
jgi:lipopolysaccharide transport system ATP-binding protein